MVREYNKDFQGKCCDDNYGTCDWTCEQILERIASRAPIGMVYSRGEIDTVINAINAQISAAVASNSILVGPLSSRPAPSSGNQGYMFVTDESDVAGGYPSNYDDPDNTPSENFYQQVFVSDGTQWIEIVDREAYTRLSAFTGDMEKATYDVGDDGFIDVAAGGTGQNLASDFGHLYADGAGAIELKKNFLRTLSDTYATDVILSENDETVQFINPTTDIDFIMPQLNRENTWFRLINKSFTETVTVRTSIAGSILIELKDPTIGTPDDVRAADFHFDTDTNSWIAIKLQIA